MKNRRTEDVAAASYPDWQPGNKTFNTSEEDRTYLILVSALAERFAVLDDPGRVRFSLFFHQTNKV